MKFACSGIFGPIDEREESDGPLSMKLQSPAAAASNPEASNSDELNNNSTRSETRVQTIELFFVSADTDNLQTLYLLLQMALSAALSADIVSKYYIC